ncbi:MAG: glycosyltransferase [Xanthobacteraceae bacterium]|nr:glycosyltransferase [Xanthobacteraceae bacterium]
MELTVVIPSFGLTALLRACLFHLEAGLQAADISRYAIAVVDNGSVVPYRSDQFPCDNLALVRLDKRTSFSRACNVGASSSPSRRYLFLNNDVLLQKDALRDMLQLFARPNVAVCGARLVYPDDLIQHCGVRFDAGPRGCYHEYHRRPSSSVSRAVRDFQAVTGAVFLVDGDLFGSLGGFDEAFPFGYEDVDFCLRARQIGAAVTCSQAVDSIHFSGTSNQDPSRQDASRAVFFRRWANRFSIDGTISE